MRERAKHYITSLPDWNDTVNYLGDSACTETKRTGFLKGPYTKMSGFNGSTGFR